MEVEFDLTPKKIAGYKRRRGTQTVLFPPEAPSSASYAGEDRQVRDAKVARTLPPLPELASLPTCCSSIVARYPSSPRKARRAWARHSRAKHRDSYFGELGSSAQRVPRWTPEERRQLASHEAFHIRRGEPVTVAELADLLGPNRSASAVQAQRKHPVYQDTLRALLKEGVPTGAVADGSQAPTEEDADTSLVKLTEAVIQSPEAKGLFLNTPTLMRIVKSASTDLKQPLLADLQGALDNEYAKWFASIRPDLPEEHTLKPVRQRKIKAPARKVLSTRKARRRSFKRVQTLWNKNRKRCAHTVLDGSWAQEVASLPLKEQEPFWKTLFEHPSKADDRKPVKVGPTVWECMAPITAGEVKAATKRMKDGAPGPDGLTREQVRAIRPEALAVRFNLWLLAGHQPRQLRRGTTVLIPKGNDAKKPEDHRPITLGNMIGRLLHSLLARRWEPILPIANCQRAFRQGDGAGINTLLLHSIIRDRVRKGENLALAFVDVRKAFDSVSHETIVSAAERVGVPPRCLGYLTSCYTGLRTTLRVGKERSEEISVGRGVRQGDPLSPLLFNAVIDWAVGSLPQAKGVQYGNQMITCLAFADDIVLIAEHAEELKGLLQGLVAQFGLAGLSINATKSATLRLHGDRQTKLSRVNPRSFASVDGTLIPALSLDDTYKYLGIRIAPNGDVKPQMQSIVEKGLANLTRAPLKPQQRQYLLGKHLVPKLFHEISLHTHDQKELKKVDRTIRKAVRQWLVLPNDTPVEFFYADVDAGGLGMVWLRYAAILMRQQRVQAIVTAEDPVVAAFAEHSKSFGLFVDKANRNMNRLPAGIRTKSELQNWITEHLHATADGRGAANFLLSPPVSRWVNNGDVRTTGSLYIKSIKVRGSLNGVPRRLARSYGGEGKCDECPTKLGTANHVLQVCPRTHDERVKRHNAIVSRLRGMLERKKYKVLLEPRLKYGDTYRKPDILAWSGGVAHILDVAVVSDNIDPGIRCADKSKHYRKRDILRDVSKRTGATTPKIAVEGVVVNWRGAIASRTAKYLRERLELSPKQLETLSRCTVEGSARGIEAYHRRSTGSEGLE